MNKYSVICNKKIIKNTFMILFLLFFISSFLSMRYGKISISNNLLIGAIVIYAVNNILIFLDKETEYKTYVQFLIINIIISMVLYLALLCKDTQKNWYAYLEVCIFNFLAVMFLIEVITKAKNRFSIKKNHLFIAAVCIFYFLLELDGIFATPRWDALVYYDANWGDVITKIPEKFDFTMASLDAFQIQSHYSYGYGFIATIGEFIGNGQAYGVILIQVILTMIMLGCFYGIMNFFFENYKNSFNIIATLFLAVSPIIMGHSIYISTDYPMLAFFIIFVYLELKEYKYLSFFVAILFVFSKEPALIMYGGYLAYKWLYEYFVNNQFTIKSFGIYVWRNLVKFVVFFSPLILWLLALMAKDYAYFGHWDLTQDSVITTSKTAETNYFGISVENIVIKLKQIFVLNFQWIITLGILIMLVYLIIKKVDKEFKGKLGKLGFIFVPIASNVVFNMMYVTVYNTRYVLVCVFGLYFLCLVLLYNVIKNVKWMKVILVVASIVMLVQSYTSIDVVSNIVFPSKKIGAVTVVASGKEFGFTDCVVNNKTYIYIEKILNKAYELIEDKNPAIAIDNSSGNKVLELWGDYSYREIYWNRNKKKITYDVTDEKINILSWDTNNIYRSESQRTYYFCMPWDDEEIINRMKKEYKINSCKNVRYMGCEMKVYELE